MKTLTSIYVCICVLAGMAMFEGCGSTPQTTAYKTIGSMETTVSASYDAYIAGVIKGQFPTNQVPLVSKAFNTFQAAATVAVNLASGSTNAPPTSDLILDAANLATAITAAETTK
jgi:hypothetical protein